MGLPEVCHRLLLKTSSFKTQHPLDSFVTAIVQKQRLDRLRRQKIQVVPDTLLCKAVQSPDDNL